MGTSPGPQEANQQYSDLIIEKDRWKVLHTFIKPASDADTLVLPVPLIRLAAEHMRKVKGIASAELVTLLTHELNYFQDSTGLKELHDLIFGLCARIRQDRHFKLLS